MDVTQLNQQPADVKHPDCGGCARLSCGRCRGSGFRCYECKQLIEGERYRIHCSPCFAKIATASEARDFKVKP